MRLWCIGIMPHRFTDLLHTGNKVSSFRFFPDIITQFLQLQIPAVFIHVQHTKSLLSMCFLMYFHCRIAAVSVL